MTIDDILQLGCPFFIGDGRCGQILVSLFDNDQCKLHYGTECNYAKNEVVPKFRVLAWGDEYAGIRFRAIRAYFRMFGKPKDKP